MNVLNDGGRRGGREEGGREGGRGKPVIELRKENLALK